MNSYEVVSMYLIYDLEETYYEMGEIPISKITYCFDTKQEAYDCILFEEPNIILTSVETLMEHQKNTENDLILDVFININTVNNDTKEVTDTETVVHIMKERVV
jgi:hypothetical protein